MFFFILFFPCLAPSPVKSQNALPQKINVIILAGQSNMAGQGGVSIDAATNNITWDGVVPEQCQPNPSILRLSANLTWVEAREPLHADIDVTKVNGIGPGMPFANAVLTRDPSFGTVGLVPCAIGGTKISQWQKGESFYQQLMRRATTAVQGRGVYAAMLWYQGESDTSIKEDAELYKGRLTKFFTDFRSDLQAPSLPIFQVALASGEGPYVEIVREAQLGLNLSNVQCVDAKGLPLKPDGLHLTSTAQVTLGQMLADAFLRYDQSNITLSSNNASTKSFSCFLFCLLIVLWMNLVYKS
ncbi:hypothetical protein SLE2022_213740 [Rubroshorea leprosula]